MSKGIPYSVDEAQMAVDTHVMDVYHKELMQFLIDKLRDYETGHLCVQETSEIS